MAFRNLLFHTFQHYNRSTSQDSSAGNVRSFSLANDNVPCNWQPAYSGKNEVRKQDNEQEAGKAFFADASVFAAITIDDRIVIDSVNYMVTGKKNAVNAGRVYSLTLVRDLRP